jgi:putative effector of murein hydrolase LrgA (UPF0299 family)
MLLATPVYAATKAASVVALALPLGTIAGVLVLLLVLAVAMVKLAGLPDKERG